MPYELDAGRRLILTQDTWALIRSVNYAGNAVEWTAENKWGVGDRWELTRPTGMTLEDCDGIALHKMHELLNAGVPSAPLLFTLCRNELGEDHAVLCIATNRGDYVLDPRFDDIATYEGLRDLGYQFLFRTSIGGRIEDLLDKIKELR
jgi:predicted transglutaminase-like cysteine proteinase